MKYHVARDGQQIGIFVEYEIRDGLKSGELRGSDLYWQEGMAEWLPLKSAHEVFPEALNASTPPATVLGLPPETETGGAVLATLSQRLQAGLMDISMVSVCLVFNLLGEQKINASGQLDATGSAMVLMGGLGALALLVYNITMLCTRGQTAGKQWMNIRIVNFDDGSNPGFVKVVLLRGICSGLIGAIPYLGLAYAVADLGYIFRADRRCLHDLLAGTHVVQGSPPKK